METYHDYVIKDGKFIGKFDEMYAKFDDPWTQSLQPNKYSRIAGILHLKAHNIRSVLECGCGLGYYANWIRQETNITPKSIDISPMAIERARKTFPNLDFEISNIVSDLTNYKNYDCVLFSEIVWYILPDLDNVLKTLQKHFADKYLIVNQVFYKGSQKYGNAYFTNLQEFINYVPFTLLGRCEATLRQETTVETSTIFKISKAQ
ncbi:class I SAM-dependent methyltransferase [Xanthocytophaga agilis]|uniref:Class I SAM-dependent methyltransferase n=1 Tax=Xanthocytophaga agilis TaxID=3048010 RepID=A0AAE3R5A3_9BACT|nr:class I SAM-dependent methyltransferase [Xanthocytophaga agilis]MDJ1501694.1 class I SAM-dependent methyltransferase [Xanthocytophaga agilis]